MCIIQARGNHDQLVNYLSTLLQLQLPFIKGILFSPRITSCLLLNHDMANDFHAEFILNEFSFFIVFFISLQLSPGNLSSDMVRYIDE